MTKEKIYITETFLYVIAIALWYGWQWFGFSGEYLDTDNYYHALRVMLFLNEPTYWEQVFPFSNYPDGEVLHWTRLLDWFWVVLYLPFSFFYPLKEAVFYSGLLIAPICFMGGAWYLLKCGRRFFDWKYRLLTAVLILMQANVMRVVVLNRPDHHACFFLLTVLIFYKMLKFCKYSKIKDLIFSAVVCALALFLAVEGVFLALAVFIFLYYGYLVLGYSYRYLLYFAFYYMICITGFWLLNPPYEGFLFADSGRISIFYVAAFVAVYMMLYLGKFIKKQVLQGCFFFLCCLLISGIYWALGWLTSPLDKQIIPLFVNRITEMNSGNIYTMAYPVCALLCMAFLLKRFIYNSKFILLFIHLLLFGLLSAYTFHFTPYAGVYAAFGLAFFVFQAKKKILWSVCFVLLEYVSFIMYALVGSAQNMRPFNLPVKDFIVLPEGTFATDIFFAPYLIWYGGHSVIASPYHRNVEGIVDNHKIFFSPDESEVRALLDKHQVKYVLLLPDYDTQYYSAPKQNCDKLYGKILGCQQYPAWLKPLHEGSYYLFSYDKEK